MTPPSLRRGKEPATREVVRCRRTINTLDVHLVHPLRLLGYYGATPIQVTRAVSVGSTSRLPRSTFKAFQTTWEQTFTSRQSAQPCGQLYHHLLDGQAAFAWATGSGAAGWFFTSILALGKVKPKVLPLPSVLLNKIAPPWAITTFLAINRPNPVPSGRIFRALPAR
jgi:hypothetical protein